MSDPIEIMARAATPISREDLSEESWLSDDELHRMMRVAITALEASGWRLVHPDQVTEEMFEAFKNSDCHDDIEAAIRAAPTYGDKG